jgi:hypothetical protein
LVQRSSLAWTGSNLNPDILSLGPVAKVNGQEFGTQGIANPKGSIDGAGAITFIVDSVVPMLNAHGTVATSTSQRNAPSQPEAPSPPNASSGPLSSGKRAVLTCDCVGTHMTTEFLEKCEKNHLVVCLRTPNCSHAIQFEDLVNFWQFKNAADVGWCALPPSTLPDALARGAAEVSCVLKTQASLANAAAACCDLRPFLALCA